MDHLDGRHKGQDLLSLSAEHPVCLHHEKGTEPLASGLYTVIHGLEDRLLEALFLRQVRIHLRLCFRRFLFQ